MLKYLIAILLIAHGLAHLAGVFAPWTKEMQGFKDVPWLFSRTITYKSTMGKAFSLVWLAASICLVIAGIGFLLGGSWWIAMAIAGCICSLVAILPWWNAVVPGARFGALFDILVLIVLISPLKTWLLQAIP